MNLFFYLKWAEQLVHILFSGTVDQNFSPAARQNVRILIIFLYSLVGIGMNMTMTLNPNGIGHGATNLNPQPGELFEVFKAPQARSGTIRLDQAQSGSIRHNQAR